MVGRVSDGVQGTGGRGRRPIWGGVDTQSVQLISYYVCRRY